MTIVAKHDPRWRWELVLAGPDTLGNDLGFVGTWVGPRTGPDKRTHGQKEDYVLRRLLVAWRECGNLNWPVKVSAETTAAGEPDFLVTLPTGQTLGVEVTEAGEETYQKWLTHADSETQSGDQTVHHVPLNASTERSIQAIADAVRKKNAKYDTGHYRSPSECDLLIYDNTAWGGFRYKGEIIEAVRKHNDLRGRFRQVHVVFGSLAYLDVFGECRNCDLRNVYEIDYAGWVFDQVERLRRERPDGIDWANVAEELEDLGKSERRALASHLRVVLMHLLKWEFQPQRRSESWRHTIGNGRSEAAELLQENPSFGVGLDAVVRRQYSLARQQAARETDVSIDTFPEEPPYGLDQILDPDFLPGSD